MTAAVMPDLREATLADFEGINALSIRHGLKAKTEEQWTWLWSGNPAWLSRPNWPVGWVLEHDGAIVGALCSIPLDYWFQGQRLTASTGRGWAVDPDFRSFGAFLMGEYYGQDVDLLFSTTVNGLAASSPGAFGSVRVPAGNWDDARFWITSHRGFAEVALGIKSMPAPHLLSFPAGLAISVRDAVRGSLPKPPAGCTVETLSGFEESFDTFWRSLREEKPSILLADRSRQTLDWHFRLALARGEAWIHRVDRAGRMVAYAVYLRQDHSESGLRRMRLADFQSLDPNPGFLAASLRLALRRCRDENIHVLEQVGTGLRQTPLVDAYAPYRRSLPAWSFHYKAQREELAAALTDARVWEPSVYDGDSSI